MIVRNISLYTSLIISFYIPYCICHGMEFIPCMTSRKEESVTSSITVYHRRWKALETAQRNVDESLSKS